VPNGEIRRVGNTSQHLVARCSTSRSPTPTPVIKRVADEVWNEDDGVLEEPEL